MGRFGRGGSAPRVVGVDFGAPGTATPWSDPGQPPAAPAPDVPLAADPGEVAPLQPDVPVYDTSLDDERLCRPPAAETPQYPPPAYPPPAYPPPVVPQQAAYEQLAEEQRTYDTSVATAIRLPATAPVQAPAAMPWAPPPARGTSLTKAGRTGAAVALSLGLLAGRVYLRSADDDVPSPAKPVAAGAVRLVTPDELGHIPRLTTPRAQRVEQLGSKMMPKAQQPRAALYGVDDKSAYLLYAHLAETTDSRLVLKPHTSIAKGDGDRVGTPKRMAGGVTCAAVTSTRRGARVICAWGGEISNGAVIEYGTRDLAAVATIAVEARTKVNGG